ncbi:MAG: CheR family methyltransferase [Halanaerobiales bacterium]
MLDNKLSDKEFSRIKKIVFENIGINLTDRKKALVVSRLSRRLRELNFAGFEQYIEYLKDNPAEIEKLSNRITTNVTHFFRERNHFIYLKNIFLPELVKNKGKRVIRAWSAGCSTGEEPYTIALVLKDFFADRDKSWKINILASDINTDVLKTAARGIFSKKSVSKIPYDLLKEYFLLGTGNNQNKFKVKKEIRDLITFRKINLNTGKSYPIGEPLDFIFCRNVFIYFDSDTQARILDRFYNNIYTGGRLFLGHSEKINPAQCQGECWRLCAPTIYKRL